jgi:hypothetical protein
MLGHQMQMASDRISGIRLKIERAEKHILDLGTELTAFLDSNPYEFGREFEAHVHRTAFRLVRYTPIPSRISLITGDAIHNLRSALDYLVWELIKPEVRKLKPRQISFPIYESFEKYESSFPGKIKVMEMGQEAANAIAACKPYKSGNHTLWLLSELDNFDKHRLLVTVSTYLDKLLVRLDWSEMQILAPEIPTELLGGPDQPPATFIVSGERAGFKEGDVVFYAPGNRVDDEDFQLAVNVSLGEAEVPDSEPLLVTIQGMLNLVDNLVCDFVSLLH